MRIISGKSKGIKLENLTDKKIRPLKDMAREGIFNFLKHSNKIFFQLEHINVLDLYSGTGSFGLECLSRKAKEVIFVEKEKQAVEILKKNIEKLKFKNQTKIIFSDVVDELKKINNLKFDLIFCDPPFKEKNIILLIEIINQKKLLKENGLIIIHRNKKTEDNIPNYFKIIDERVYGTSKIIIGNF